MVEEKNMPSKSGCCGYDHKSLLYWLIGFVVLVVVFCVGYRLGQWKSYYYGYGQNYGYQYSPMMRGGGYPGYGYGMMGGWRAYDNALPPATTPVAESATATPQQ
ncbi:MAG: hypothetical protein ACD_72C00100G0004 [uncultured bacterium]|nr:MAG: hypothetical protein ACD_72C00100G0004 [uncultured bacterium]